MPSPRQDHAAGILRRQPKPGDAAKTRYTQESAILADPCQSQAAHQAARGLAGKPAMFCSASLIKMLSLHFYCTIMGCHSLWKCHGFIRCKLLFPRQHGLDKADSSPSYGRFPTLPQTGVNSGVTVYERIQVHTVSRAIS